MKNRTNVHFLDLSGYSFTGKTALIELLREFKGFHVPEINFEFLLLRIQGGIRDLETALVDDWSPIRVDAATHNFKRVVKRLGSKHNIFNPNSWFSAVGWNYEQRYDCFFMLSNQYINDLVEIAWKQYWPYPLVNLNGVELLWRKILYTFHIKCLYEHEVYMGSSEYFLSTTKNYLYNLLTSNITSDITTVVMHNAFEPYNPHRSLKYFDSAQCIVIDRDPRDCYVAMKKIQPWSMPVDQFIIRYRLQRKMASKNRVESENILYLQYEELIADYDMILDKLLSFLNKDRSIHIHPRQYFDPSISAKYVDIWKEYNNQSEIEQIYQNLQEFCYKG